MELQDIKGLNGAPNMPGVGTTIWFCPKDDLAVVQVPAEGEVEITTAHVPKPGKGFIQVYNSLQSGGVEGGQKGGIDGYYIDQTYTGFIPGIRPEVAKLMMTIQNMEGIWIIRHNGRYIQLGSKDLPAYCSYMPKTGKVGGDDVAGYEIKIASFDIANWFYNATIPLKPNGGITSGAASVNAPAPTATAVYVARVVQGSVTVELGRYAAQDGDDQAALAAGIAAAASANGFTVTADGAIVELANANAYNGWTFQVAATSNTFSGTAFGIIGAAGADGNTATATASFNGVVVPLGSYEKQSGDTSTDVAAGLAAACASNPLGLLVSNDANVVNFTVPDLESLVFDGTVINIQVTGSMTQTATLAERTF